MSYVNAGIAIYKFGSAWGQATADRMNANTQQMLLDYQGEQEINAAKQQADIIRRAGQYAAARATSAYAASGVAVDSGSAVDTTDKITADATHDAYMTILTGEKRADALRAQGRLGAISAGARANQQILGAAASALSSGYSAYQGRQTGWATSGNSYGGINGGTYANWEYGGKNTGVAD